MSRLDKPHICFVSPDTWPVLADDRRIESVGGAQVQQSLLAKGLAQRGFRVSMICMDYGQPDGVTVDGVTVVKCHAPVQGLPVIRFFHPRLTGLWSALRRVDADIYYQRAAAAMTGVIALFAKRHRRRFVYAAAHDLDLARDQTWKIFQRRSGWRDRQLFQLGLKLADDILAQHAGQVRDCQRWHRRIPTLVPSCYAAQSGDVADSNGVVLWVSTLRAWKRPELFLELARRLPHVRFRMVGGVSAEAGGGLLFARIKEAAATMPNLEFAGFVPFGEIDAHFNAARVFVNTSDYEGFPNTFLQSWSREIPTVSFCDPGSALNGAPVVNVAKDLGQMAALVEHLMVDDGYWRETGRRVRECYETCHTPTAAMDTYERVFEKQQATEPMADTGMLKPQMRTRGWLS
jgi:glycosyltransferase involved in cell wall biosynthesis